MHKLDVVYHLKRKGYMRDNYGHFKSADGKIRFKMQKTSMRVEKKVSCPSYNGKTVNKWHRIKSAYYCNISITEDDKLKINQRIV